MKDTQKNIRLRFAPSPTGPLHIGGLRTALYNSLFVKKHGGKFILRIEDTDQNRYVEGAENYIQKALEWCGISIDEGPKQGGDFGPYRQSERITIYKKYATELLQKGLAYKAYDSPEELNAKREEAVQSGNHNWQYDANSRMQMRNSLSLSKEEVDNLEKKETPYVIRFKVPEKGTIYFTDLIRGQVSFDTDILDDKVLYKADGFPTYHMANVIDDYHMKISHVIRGEEWLSSTPLHVLLYKAMGWEESMPKFAHLPLILKPQGQGKLSKRDGAKFGFPVFPLSWTDPESKEIWQGYREIGFLPEGFINFLAFLGWNPGTEQELFNQEELANQFDINRVNKSGARFDYEKALWFNQQHLIAMDDEKLTELAKPFFEQKNIQIEVDLVKKIVHLFKERVHLLSEFPDLANYIFNPVSSYDEKMIRKKWKPELSNEFNQLCSALKELQQWDAESIEDTVKTFMNDHNLSFGKVLPVLRLAICGTMKGPSIFHVMALLNQTEAIQRVTESIPYFNKLT